MFAQHAQLSLMLVYFGMAGQHLSSVKFYKLLIFEVLLSTCRHIRSVKIVEGSLLLKASRSVCCFCEGSFLNVHKNSENNYHSQAAPNKAAKT
jgi:hypothetical protein